MSTSADSPKATFSEVIEVKPAASVWNDPCPTQLDEQGRFFETNGFLVLPQVLGPSELAELERDLENLAENYSTTPQIREGFDLEPTQDKNRKGLAFRKIGGLSELTEAFGRLMRHHRILDVLHTIIGPTIHLWRDVAMMKPALVGREKPWHQDSAYWPWKPMSLVSAMTALDDAGPDNGCLQVIPGSHKQLVQHYGGELRIDLDEQLQAQTVYVPLKAGDTLIFHSLMLHASEPNRSNQDRRVCIYSYMSPDLEYIGKGDRSKQPFVSSR